MLGTVVSRTRGRLDQVAAVRQAREFCRSRPCAIRICWDLDNTLVGTGELLKAGHTLSEAIVEAHPVPNMLELYAMVCAAFPEAEHFILSARSRSMRDATVTWLEHHNLSTSDAALCLIPTPYAKPKVWRELAADARLVIVDDLAFNHEEPEQSLYHDLIREAEHTACCYIGTDGIASISADRASIAHILQGIVDAVGPAPAAGQAA